MSLLRNGSLAPLVDSMSAQPLLGVSGTGPLLLMLILHLGLISYLVMLSKFRDFEAVGKSVRKVMEWALSLL